MEEERRRRRKRVKEKERERGEGIRRGKDERETSKLSVDPPVKE